MTTPDLPATLGNAEVLSANTPAGLPYPVSSDPANQGANAIKALALAVDAYVTVAPMLWVYYLAARTNQGQPYLFTKINKDTASGYDPATGRYTVPKTGTYLGILKVQMDGSGGITAPGIQIAPTVGGTYVTKIGAGVSGVQANSAYVGNLVVATLPLTAGNGVRGAELAAGFTGDTGSDGSNYFQLAFLGA